MLPKFFDRVVVILLLCPFWSTAVWAITYHAIVSLKDGKKVEGKLVQMTPEAIGLDPDGPVSYRAIPADEILTVYIAELNQTFTFPLASEDIPAVFAQQKKLTTPGTIPRPAGFPGFGFTFGQAVSLTEEAIAGFADTEFQSGGLVGGSFFYSFVGGFVLELNVSRFKMALTESGENFGDLQLTSALVLFKYQTMPDRPAGFAYHGELGGGLCFTGFKKSGIISRFESLGARFDIETDNPFVFEMGGGIDYFFSKTSCLTLDGRMLLGNVGTRWQVSGPAATLPLQDVDKLFASNLQILFGVRLGLPSQ